MNADVLDFPPIEAPPLVEQAKPAAAVAKQPAAELSLETFDLSKLALAYLAPLRADAAAVKEKFTGLVVDVSTQTKIDEGRSLVHRLVAKPIAATRKTEAALKDKLNGTKTDVVAEAAAIIALFDEAAQPVRTQLDEGQTKLDEEKRKKAEAEAARVAAHEAGIAKVRAYLARCQEPGMTAERIATGIKLLEAVTFGPEWQEFAAKAAEAQAETLTAMRELHTAAVEREAAAAQAEADRIAREAEQQRQAAENARVAAELAAQKAALDAQAAELAAREQAAATERARVERLTAAVAAIHARAAAFDRNETALAWDIFQAVVEVEDLDVSEAAFQEFAPMAADARRLVLAALLKAKDAAEAREAAAKAAAVVAEAPVRRLYRVAAPVAEPVAAQVDASPAVVDDGAPIRPDEPAEVIEVATVATPAGTDLFGAAPAQPAIAYNPAAELADCRVALTEALQIIQKLVNDMDQSKVSVDKTARELLSRVAELRALGGI